MTVEQMHGHQGAGGVSPHKGVPDERQNAHHGVPYHMPFTGSIPEYEAPEKPRCQGTTVKGKPCKAFSVRGDILCAGHMRSELKGN